MTKQLKAHLALLTVAFLYGGNYTFAKEVMGAGQVHPIGLTGIRIMCGFLFFTIIHILFVKEKVAQKDWKIFLICALSGVILNQSLFLLGLNYTKPINASLIVAMTPIIVIIMAYLLIKETITPKKILGIVIGFTGTAILILRGKDIQLLGSQSLGDFLILCNSVSFGLFLVLSRTLMQKYNAITVIRWIFTIGFFCFIPFSYSHIGNIEWSGFELFTWFSIVYAVVGATFGTYLLNMYGVKRLGPTMVSVYIYVQPFAATLIAVGLDKDELTILKVACGLLIFMGVYFVTFSSPKRSDEEKNKEILN